MCELQEFRSSLFLSAMAGNNFTCEIDRWKKENCTQLSHRYFVKDKVLEQQSYRFHSLTAAINHRIGWFRLNKELVVDGLRSELALMYVYIRHRIQKFRAFSPSMSFTMRSRI